MARYRNALAQLGGELFLTDGGIETQLTVMGGCCGTDHRHVEQIAKACLPFLHTATHSSAST